MDDRSAMIAAALEQVGPRLKRLRTQRQVTLTALAAATGISKSTLSRLETGQRKASLELLLPLAMAYNVPLDDLVGGPDIGDPRVRLKPRRVKGRTVIPLTQQPAAPRPGRSSSPRRSRPRNRAAMTVTNGCTCCPAGCGWSWATVT